MTESRQDEVTRILAEAQSGDDSAAARLMPLVYDELRRLAAGYFRQQPGQHTLQPTAVVHEAFLRLVNQTGAAWNDRVHFFNTAAMAMRQLLAAHARKKHAAKRGGDWQRVTLDRAVSSSDVSEVDLLALDDALTKLSALDERQGRIAELRFLAGLSVEETAEALGVSPRTIELDWRMARAWLQRELGEESAT